jgi:Domain of unknown function (DUF1841)
MMYGNDPVQYRRFFHETWRKHGACMPLQPLEEIVARIIADHPEYHALLEDPDRLDHDYSPEAGRSNPFLHMGLHIAIREQLAVDRPAGIRALYQRLVQGHADPHHMEHRMAECLAESLWEAQRAGGVPDEAAYLERLRGL